MAEKKQLFPVDKSAFSPEEVAKAKVSRIKKKKITLEELLLAAKDLGLSVYIPSSSEDKEKQEESLSKLGFIDESSKTSKSSKDKSKKLVGTLYGRHIVSGQAFGPGTLELDIEESDLFNSLMKQDQLAMSSLRDTTDFSHSNRCFMITSGNGRDQFNKYSKIEIAPESFNAAMNTYTATTVGGVDAAGYKVPNSGRGDF